MLKVSSTRAGRLIEQPAAYEAFVPAPLPPQPPIDLSGKVMVLLSEASLALGRLDGVRASFRIRTCSWRCTCVRRLC